MSQPRVAAFVLDAFVHVERECVDGSWMKMIVVTPADTEWTPPPPDLVQMSRLVMPHMHQEGMKRVMTHITRLSGQSRAASQAGLD